MRLSALALCAAFFAILAVGCKPATPPPDSGKIGAVAGGVKERAEQAAGQANKAREREREAAADNE